MHHKEQMTKRLQHICFTGLHQLAHMAQHPCNLLLLTCIVQQGASLLSNHMC